MNPCLEKLCRWLIFYFFSLLFTSYNPHIYNAINLSAYINRNVYFSCYIFFVYFIPFLMRVHENKNTNVYAKGEKWRMKYFLNSDLNLFYRYISFSFFIIFSSSYNIRVCVISINLWPRWKTNFFQFLLWNSGNFLLFKEISLIHSIYTIVDK